MRSGLILLLLGLPGAALAAEDRYGPSRRHDPITASAALASGQPTNYRGSLLNWSGKPAAAVQAVAPPHVAPLHVAPPPPVFASRGPEPARLPTSLYDVPATAPTQTPAAAPPGPGPRAAWPRAAAVQPSLPPPPSAPPVAGSPAYAYSPPRAYSVVREWGGTPDRIPSPPRAEAFSGREVALDPNTLGSAGQPDPPPEDEVDEERPPPKQATKAVRK